jgi:hypothetical protein
MSFSPAQRVLNAELDLLSQDDFNSVFPKSVHSISLVAHFMERGSVSDRKRR